jgi:hypothetical protein
MGCESTPEARQFVFAQRLASALLEPCYRRSAHS